MEASQHKVTFAAAMEIASHEAVIRQTYKDSVGVLTWSVGMTNATGHRVERYIGKPAPLQTCLDVYAWALENYADGVRRAFKGYDLTDAQFAAALSFHWNTGKIESASWVRKWKARDIAGARAAFLEWNKPKAIKARRKKEHDLFFDGVWSGDGTMIEYTRLTKNMTPVWSSAKRINVETELRAAFLKRIVGVQDQPPRPDAPVLTPTLSPSLASIIVAAIKALLSALSRKE